jgi:hypothetical protein
MKAPPLGQWHMIRVVAVGDHIQAWLNGIPYLDYRDARLRSGRVGLWTKADSITAFMTSRFAVSHEIADDVLRDQTACPAGRSSGGASRWNDSHRAMS